MPSDANFLDINLFGKEYRIACPSEEKDALLRAVAYVDGQMHEIAKKTRSNATERVAVMAALNIAHDFLLLQNQPSEENPTPVHPSEGGLDFGAVKGRIALMEAQLNAVLEPQDKLI